MTADETTSPAELPERPEGWTRHLVVHLNFGGGKGGARYTIHDAEGRRLEHLAYQYDTRMGGFNGFALPDVERPMTWAELREEWPKYQARRAAALTASCQAPTIAAPPKRTPMDTRMYYVKRKDVTEDKGRLVEASHPAQAFRHVAKDLLEVTLPTALEVARLMQDGMKPEDANAKPTPEIPF